MFKCNAFFKLRFMRLHGIEPDAATWISVLKSCTRSLQEGRQVHQQLNTLGLGALTSVANALISMYGRCGCCSSAKQVFEEMLQRDVVSWNAMITAFSRNGYLLEAVEIFDSMQEVAEPDAVTLISALGVCCDPSFLQFGKKLHALAVDRDILEAEVAVGNAVINMYSKCGCLKDAYQVFRSLSKRDVISWNAMISAFVQNGESFKAVSLFRQMQLGGFRPSKVTMVTTLSSCFVNPSEMASYISQLGFEGDTIVGNALLNAFGRCGQLEDARRTFVKLEHTRDVVSWNAMITAYVQLGHCFQALQVCKLMLQLAEIQPNAITFVAALGACTSPEFLVEGKLIHSCILELNLQTHLVVGNALLSMYNRCGDSLGAQAAFEVMRETDVLTWNALIASYVHKQGEAIRALQRMLLEAAFRPDRVTYASVLSTCSIDGGKFLHSLVCESGYNTDPVVANALLVMYSRCHHVEDALTIFACLRDRDEPLLWNTAIAICMEHGRLGEANKLFGRMNGRNVATWNVMLQNTEATFGLFRKMQLEGEKANRVTFLALLEACSSNAAVNGGGSSRCPGLSEVQRFINDSIYRSDKALGGALVKALSNCGMLEEARRVFEAIPGKDVVSWTTMIAACVQNCESEQALQVFEQMQKEELRPDGLALLSALGACRKVEECKKIHKRFQTQIKDERMVKNALVTVYGKLGALDEALNVFQSLTRPTSVSWNAIIAAYAGQGCLSSSLRMFRSMQFEGMKPTELTFVSVLAACSHSGQVNMAGYYFSSLVYDYGVQPSSNHLGCFVDVLARAGWLVEAGKVASKQQDSLPWMALLSACQVQGDVDNGVAAANEVFRLDPRNFAARVVFRNTVLQSTKR